MDLALSLPPNFHQPTGGDLLIDCLGSAIETHVVIIGDHTVDLICALIRLGCPAARSMHYDERLGADVVETVLVPHVASSRDAERAIAMAVRMLVPTGRIFLHASSDLLDPLEAKLLRHGFCAFQRTPAGGNVVLSGELPMLQFRSQFSGISHHG